MTAPPEPAEEREREVALLVVPEVGAEPPVVLFDAEGRPLVRTIGFFPGLRPAR